MGRILPFMMPDKVNFRLEPELKKIIVKEANRLGTWGAISQVIVSILAAHYKRPDLSKVPRKRMGLRTYTGRRASNGYFVGQLRPNVR